MAKKRPKQKTSAKGAAYWRRKSQETTNELTWHLKTVVEKLEIRCEKLGQEVEELNAEVHALREDVDDLRDRGSRRGRRPAD